MEDRIGLLHESLTSSVIAAAIRVHRELGPGLLESAYEACLAHELLQESIPFARQVNLPIQYRGLRVDAGYRLDLVVADVVLVELKAVERTLPLHEAQLVTYLRLSGLSVGLLINFNVPRLRDGIIRRVLTSRPHPPVSTPCSPRSPR